MVVLGLLLLLASGAALVAVVHANTDTTTVSAFGTSFTDVSLGGLVLLGALAGLVLALGLLLMVDGARRRRARRIQHRRAVRDVRTEKEKLEDENAALRAQLGSTDPYPTESAAANGAVGEDRYTSTGTFADSGRHGKRGLFRR
ncbi:MAG: hypothetical protein WCD35_04685 [Mycobacteriales bacterium]